MVDESLREHDHSKKVKILPEFLKWAELNLRNFPWRSPTVRPYGVLVAEILLKRTTATAASRLYPSFLSKYPSVKSLSASTEEQLADDLSSIGLHTQRAQGVKKLAGYLLRVTNGDIPASLQDLLKVPGLGQYSARAILSFGFGKPYAVVDSNVQRILERVYSSRFGNKYPIGTYQRLADALLPETMHRQFNFGMLDLGSLICQPNIPKCGDCPLQSVCDYANTEPIEPELSVGSSKVRNARLANGLSLVRLASLSGVSKLTIVNLEKGRTKPKAETLEKLLRVLG